MIFNVLRSAHIALGCFVGMVALLEIGRRIGMHRARKDPEGSSRGIGAAEGSDLCAARAADCVHVLEGPWGVSTPPELDRRGANAIGTAYLRVDAGRRPTCTRLARQLFRAT